MSGKRGRDAYFKALNECDETGSAVPARTRAALWVRWDELGDREIVRLTGALVRLRQAHGLPWRMEERWEVFK